jgi:hypothetical protein
MFKYSELNHSRKAYIQTALKMFPDTGDQITNKQINEILAKANLPWPQWLTVPGNRTGRGCYNLPVPGENDTMETPDGEVITYTPPPQETDEELDARILDTYQSIDELVEAVASNNVNSLVIAGGAGLGKSFNVNRILNEYNGGESGYVFHRGYLKATHLFRLLYENREKGQTIVLDDCDLWDDQTSLNILKAALELKETRRIGWGSEKVFLDENGDEIPRYFDYQGSVIFLTNLNVRDLIASGSRLAPHLSAIESRSLVLDMRIKTRREFFAVIKLKLKDGLLVDKGINEEQQHEIMDFMAENMDKITELSLRMVEKIAYIYKSRPTTWKKLCRQVCLK